MEHRCENCGQLSLKSDQVCWHCGEPMPWYDEDALEKVQVKDGWGRNAPPSSLFLYAGITVAVLLGLFLVMASLGQQPQVQITLGTRPPDEWELITSVDKNLTFHIPVEWNWFDAGDSDHQDRLHTLVAGDKSYLAGTLPLGEAVDDLEVLFLAHSPLVSSEVTPAFMVVATSSKLNRLTYEDAITYLREGDFVLSQLQLIDNFEKSHLSIIVETASQDPSLDRLRCRQQFIRGDDLGMLATLCAPIQRYTANQATFEEIARSFQRLAP
jgi:hypothetical protein